MADNNDWPHVAEDEVSGYRFLWDNECPSDLRSQTILEFTSFLTNVEQEADQEGFEPDDLIFHLVTSDDSKIADSPCVYVYSRDGNYRGRYLPQPEFSIVRMEHGPFAGKEAHVPDFRCLSKPPARPH